MNFLDKPITLQIPQYTLSVPFLKITTKYLYFVETVRHNPSAELYNFSPNIPLKLIFSYMKEYVKKL